MVNGDGSYSRDFAYIDNVLQMNYLAITTTNQAAVNQVYNTAVSDCVSLLEMSDNIKEGLSAYDANIKNIELTFGPFAKVFPTHRQV